MGYDGRTVTRFIGSAQLWDITGFQRRWIMSPTIVSTTLSSHSCAGFDGTLVTTVVPEGHDQVKLERHDR
jgi:hypothetical protein